MKITFGKYKDKTLKDISEIDPQYIVWLNSLKNLSPNIKEAIQPFLDTCQYKVADQARSYYKRQLDVEYEDSLKYERDIEFWGRVSPCATYDHIKKYNISVSDEDWKYIWSNIRRIGK